MLSSKFEVNFWASGVAEVFSVSPIRLSRRKILGLSNGPQPISKDIYTSTFINRERFVFEQRIDNFSVSCFEYAFLKLNISENSRLDSLVLAQIKLI